MHLIHTHVQIGTERHTIAAMYTYVWNIHTSATRSAHTSAQFNTLHLLLFLIESIRQKKIKSYALLKLKKDIIPYPQQRPRQPTPHSTRCNEAHRKKTCIAGNTTLPIFCCVLCSTCTYSSTKMYLPWSSCLKESSARTTKNSPIQRKKKT